MQTFDEWLNNAENRRDREYFEGLEDYVKIGYEAAMEEINFELHYILTILNTKNDK